MNAGAVRELHEEAGLRRDALFELLDRDVEWWVAGVPEQLPWAGTFHGHDGVRRWLELLNGAMAYERFDLLELFDAGDDVIERVFASGRAVASGAPFESEVIRLWRFRVDRAIRVRSYYDTAAYFAALRG